VAVASMSPQPFKDQRDDERGDVDLAGRQVVHLKDGVTRKQFLEGPVALEGEDVLIKIVDEQASPAGHRPEVVLIDLGRIYQLGAQGSDASVKVDHRGIAGRRFATNAPDSMSHPTAK